MSKRICKNTKDDDGVKNGGDRWKGIPAEVLALIVVKIPAEEVMRVVPLVCKAWWEVVAGPHCWTNIDLLRWSRRRFSSDEVDAGVKKLVRHSRCTFQSLSVSRLGSVGFCFAANRARCLKILTMPLSDVTDEMVIKHAESLANLTHLDISYCTKITSKGIEAFGKQCKSLINLKRNMQPPFLGMSVQEAASRVDDSEAMVIADTVSKLQHLELCYGRFTNHGVNRILTECKALTFLSIEGCWSVGWEEDIEKRCEKLDVFKSPWVDDDFEIAEFSDDDYENSSESGSSGYSDDSESSQDSD